MSSRRKVSSRLAVVGLLSLVAAGFVVLRREQASSEAPPRSSLGAQSAAHRGAEAEVVAPHAADPEPPAPVASEPPVRAVVPAIRASPKSPPPLTDERSLMARLHQLGETAPLESLLLARAGNDRYPESRDAPERAWIVAKSLVNLERFAEAREEARRMVERYPDTPWTLDVERHLLTHPLE